MPSAALREGSSRHPWLAEFEREPVAAFNDLLAGYARVHPYERADAPDAARMLFGPLGADDPARRALGPAVLTWLEERRREPLPADPYRLQRRVREVCEAFEIVALLEITDAAIGLRRKFVTLNEWVARLALSSSRDARAEYWRMLALTQPLVAGSSALESHGLAPFWLQVCAEAGGRLPKRYLTIGLLGLRRLPGDALDGLEAPWLAGLARWALTRNPSREEFLSEWRPLKQLYPKAPTRWRKLVRGVLTSKVFKDAGIEPPAWWEGDPDFRVMVDAGIQQYQNSTRETYLMPPTKEEGDAVINDIRQGDPISRLRPLIEKLASKHRRYAEGTSHCDFLVRTFTNIGMHLIRCRAENHIERARIARALAQEALRWEPRNVFAWSLWRDALEVEGALEAAELVAWEFVRRIPDDPQSRVQLADLLARHSGRRAEAEAVYRETIRHFPDNAHARNQLAELLIATDRLLEAEATIGDALDTGASSPVTYAIKTRLRSHVGDVEGAWQAVWEGLRIDTGNVVLQGFLSRLQAGRGLPLVSRAFEQPAPSASAPTAVEVSGDPSVESALVLGRARRLRFRLDSANDDLRAAARAEVEAWLRDEPNLAYVEILAARQQRWAAKAATLPPVAVAFEAALAAGDRAHLDELAKRMPRLEALILVARAVLGDAEAAQWVEHWLHAESPSVEEPAVAALRTLLRPVLRLIEGGKPAAQAIAESRAVVIAALHDANEATLGDALLAA